VAEESSSLLRILANAVLGDVECQYGVTCSKDPMT